MKDWLMHVVYLVIIGCFVFIAVSTNRSLQSMTLKYAAAVAKPVKSSSDSSVPAQPSVDKPNVDQFGLQVWANIAAVRAYSYDFMNYKQQFGSLSQFYLPDAWQQFQKALESSNMLNIALTEKMSVGAVAKGAVTITQQGVESGRYTWHVVLPLRVTMASSAKKLEQQLLVKLTVVRVMSPLGQQGLAIKQFEGALLPK